MVNMIVVLIMLVNMLIAQLSWRYEQAQNDAAIQYDIDKTVMVTKLERSYFKRWVTIFTIHCLLINRERRAKTHFLTDPLAILKLQGFLFVIFRFLFTERVLIIGGVKKIWNLTWEVLKCGMRKYLNI